MSLISRRLVAGPDGTHGTSTQVRLRCRVFSKDMKSQTANAWCSIKVVMAFMLLSWRYMGWLMTWRRIGATAALSSSMEALLPFQS